MLHDIFSYQCILDEFWVLEGTVISGIPRVGMLVVTKFTFWLSLLIGGGSSWCFCVFEFTMMLISVFVVY